MKFINRILIALLLLTILFPFNIHSNAASKFSATVTANNVNVRESPTLKSKIVGKFKKGTHVTVYSKTTSEWSQILYKSKKAYVSSKYLKFTSSKASYLLDKSKIYTYKEAGGKVYYLIPTGKKYYGWDKWNYISESGEKDLFLVDEDRKGLYIGYIDSEYYTDIKYPIKVGQSWNEFEDIHRITSKTKTVKTPAGTFKNCIEVKKGSDSISYYAKNIGLVKSIYKGKTTRILFKLQKNN